MCVRLYVHRGGMGKEKTPIGRTCIRTYAQEVFLYLSMKRMRPRQSLHVLEGIGQWVSSEGGCRGSNGSRPRELTDSGARAYPSAKRRCVYFSTALLFFLRLWYFSTAVVFPTKANRPPFPSPLFFPHTPFSIPSPSCRGGGRLSVWLPSFKPSFPRCSEALAAFFRRTCAVPLLQPCEKAVSLRFLPKMV